MIPFELAAIFARLQLPAERAAGACALAAWAGVRQALVFGKDDEIGMFLPAPGLVRTLRDGRRWQQFLEQCSSDGERCAQMPDPDDGAPVQAFGLACAAGQAIFVFLDGRPDGQQCRALLALAPLLGAQLAVEHAAHGCRRPLGGGARQQPPRQRRQ
ncbi:hypothetical protein KY495_01395 [Massilia sp. PAMC28688]|uniref:hypothetical protein n=1 Tax=Massilia sp. PAMC28688 TaxID=2861283 RepID=UPI001C6358EE|nr:hypothetical protein [Massilia sp. PAMC28688]QYF93924.1 hypothetical protein KY495_01395 [Massilia sp. PAMC28688]